MTGDFTSFRFVIGVLFLLFSATIIYSEWRFYIPFHDRKMWRENPILGDDSKEIIKDSIFESLMWFIEGPPVIIIGMIIIGIAVYAIPASALVFLRKTIAFLAGNDIGHTSIMMIGVIIGSSLYILRKKRRVIYGAIEIFISMIGMGLYPSAISHNSAATSPLATWLLALMSLIYIFIRGMDNVETGWKARRAAAVVSKNPQARTG